MTTALQAHFADYGAFHQTAGNKACHYVGIPVIVLSIFALLSALPIAVVGGFQITWAEVLLIFSATYYLGLDAGLGALMLVASVLFDAAGRQIPVLPAAALFVFGWILQFIGHYVYEGKSPAFFRNVTHLLVGPLWILAKVTGRA